MNKIVLDKNGIKIGDKYEVLLCASLFYFRLPRSVWKDRIEKLKATGYNCVDVYFPWNYHEVSEGEFDFEGERDVTYFLELLSQAGLYVIVRPGPYVCSEWTGGAIPSRILETDMPIRCAEQPFLAQVKKWYDAILPLITPFEYGKNGKVILCQLDNELDFFDCPDPKKYIEALRDYALDCGVSIPLFCCCGQYNAQNACGFADGVFVTMNCYPSSSDTLFDRELRGYANYFSSIEKPLLVSETNRDHFLLRREFSCGSKLLGAYNQVAGNDFEYFQSVNNWGSPVAFLASVYDFESMIDTAGNYRKEAVDGTLFAAFLKTLGEKLGAAQPCGTVEPNDSEFSFSKGGLNVLELCGGGYVVCVPNFSEDAGVLNLTYQGKNLSIKVAAGKAPFCLFDVALDNGVKITRSNAEVIDVTSNAVVFRYNGFAQIGLDFGNGEVAVEKTCKVGDFDIIVLDDAQALDYLVKDGSIVCKEYKTKPVTALYATEVLPEQRKVDFNNGLTFGALDVNEGEVEYSLTIPANKKLFVEGACDIITVITDGEFKETCYADGRDRIYEGGKYGKYLVRAEKWGHSNFDDAQAPSLRLAVKKGVKYFGVVNQELLLDRCDFTLLDDFGSPEIDLSQKFKVRIGVNSWNSTRMPVICAYSFELERITERVILKTTEAVDINVYVDGKLVGSPAYGTFELTPYIATGENKTVSLSYRKREWTQNCGAVTVLGIDKATVDGVTALSKREMSKLDCKLGDKLSLPLKPDGGEKLTFAIDIGDIKEEGFLRFIGKNLRATCVIDNRVVGRLIIDWENAPCLTGGNPNELYICPNGYKNKVLSVYVEASGNICSLDKVEYVAFK